MARIIYPVSVRLVGAVFSASQGSVAETLMAMVSIRDYEQ